MKMLSVPNARVMDGAMGDEPTIFRLTAVVLIGAGLSFSAVAEPRHVLFSSPAADAIIHGRHAEYTIRFDGPVDHQSAHLTVTQSGKIIQSLAPLLDSAPDVLFAGAEAPPAGEYRLHWEVRSSDGETSAGEIPFRVQP